MLVSKYLLLGNTNEAETREQIEIFLHIFPIML